MQKYARPLVLTSIFPYEDRTFDWSFEKCHYFSNLNIFIFFTILFFDFMSYIPSMQFKLYHWKKKNIWRFSAWCPLKGHTYLNKPAGLNVFFWFDWYAFTLYLSHFSFLWHSDLVFAVFLKQFWQNCMQFIYKILVIFTSQKQKRPNFSNSLHGVKLKSALGIPHDKSSWLMIT